jgi:hypothetical protein
VEGCRSTCGSMKNRLHKRGTIEVEGEQLERKL